MTPRRRRMLFVALIALGVGGATAFALRAFNENMLYYVTPSELLTTPTVDSEIQWLARR